MSDDHEKFDDPQWLRQLLIHHWPQVASTVDAFTACRGGFSGARVWRLTGLDQSYCLRRWPKIHPTRSRLEFIHTVLLHVRSEGISFVPFPIKTAQPPATFVLKGTHFWELTNWMPGVASLAGEPHAENSAKQQQAAAKALAEFHIAAATFSPRVPPAVPPVVQERLARLRQLQEGHFQRIAQALTADHWSDCFESAKSALALYPDVEKMVYRELSEFANTTTALQPCIRDIHAEHVLFDRDLPTKVTGLIDFAAMRTDCISTDVARLFGDVARESNEVWQSMQAAYESIRPLDATEVRLAQVLDRSSALLSAMNWVEWIYLDRREFDDHAAAGKRFATSVRRLRCLAKTIK